MTAPDVHDAGPDAAALAEPQPRALHRARLHGGSVPERSWTPLGTVDAGVLASVDAAGSVRIGELAWSLDWWIGAEDRWHHPSREVTVRQRALDAAPVVETALRVPGGDVVHRAYGVQASAGAWRGPAVVVEVENRTAVPVALALVVRPFTLDGPGSVSMVHSDGPVISVDGRPGVLLARDPARLCAGPVGTVAGRLAAARDGSGIAGFDGPAGDLEAAFVVPLTHTAVARVLLPVVDPRGRRGRGPAPAVPGAPWDAPTAQAVAAGWAVHTAETTRVVTPEPGWSEALAWATRMLVLSGPDEVGACLDRTRHPPAGPPAAVRAAQVAEALARLGGVDGSDAIAGALAAAQRLGGAAQLGDRSDGTVALLHAAGCVLGGPFGRDRCPDLVAPVAVAVRRVRRGRGVPDGLVPSAVWALRSLAPALAILGQPEVAEDALAAATTLGATDAPRRRVAGDHDVTLDRALVVRNLLARGDGVDGLRALWDAHGDSGRSDAETASADGSASVPCGRLGFDIAELAARTCALLDLFVADGDHGPDLLAVFPSSWVGHGLEAHGLLTPWGTVSFAVRWHSGRAALLWEIERPPGSAGGSATPVVRAGGLDPGWSAAGWTGEALLGRRPAPGHGGDRGGFGPATPQEGDSFT